MNASVRTLLFAATLAAFPLNGADYLITGPHTHDNLAIFLIHGPNRAVRHYLTLQEALEQKKAIVYETSSVNELAIENLSATEDVYVQSGDIVKGGKQDRTFKDDWIIPTKSGKVAVSAFCVEHGRWTPRNQEAATHFASSPQSVATREMKMAVKVSGNQSEVWSQVASAQRRLSGRAGSVAAPASPTSFMLSLESPQLQKPVEEYTAALSGMVHDGDIVGFAYAVNGKLSSAEVYASNELFRKLWPKLLRSSVVEAIADFHEGAQAVPPTFEAVRAVLVEADSGHAVIRDLASRTQSVEKQTAGSAVFETRDRAQADSWIHRSYLVK